MWEIKGGKYAKTLAKIQIGAVFHVQDIRRNDLPRFVDLCMESPCHGTPLRGTNIWWPETI